MFKPFTCLIKSISEALRPNQAALFLTETGKVGVSTGVNFRTMTHVYLAEMAVRASIDFLADQVAGQGFYTTMNADYKTQSENRTAKEAVDEFCEQIGLDEVLQASARYLVGWGNCLWWVGNSKKIQFLRLVPLEIIRDDGFRYNSEGFLEKVVLDWNRKPPEVPGDEVIHLAYNVLTANPLGVGILQSLCTPLNLGNGEVRDPFYKIMGRIHGGMAEAIDYFGSPNQLYSFPGLSKERLQDAQAQLKTMPRKGARFVFNPPAGSDAKVTTVVAEPMRGMDYFVSTLEDEFVLGLQTPLAKLVTKTGFTEASANAALEIAERRVLALQRFLKRGVERYLFDKVVAATGLDPAQAQVRLNWGMPESLDYKKLTQILGQLTELLKVDPSVIGHEELRKILRDVAKLPLEEEEPEAEILSRVLGDKKNVGKTEGRETENT